MAILYTAKEVNAGIEKNWQEDLNALRAAGITPTLATVRIGDNGAAISYEKGAAKRMNALGLGVRTIVLSAGTPQTEAVRQLKVLNAAPGVHGILMLQPLPEGYDTKTVLNTIAPIKDVDCATMDNLGAVIGGWEDSFPYCAPAAVMELLDYYGIDVKGKNVVIIGGGLLVGRPLSMMLVNRFATVTICNVYTQNTPSLTRGADIVISATGVAGLVKANYVREGQIVIDVGTSYRDGKIRGDVDMESVEPVVYAVTPTPGGISGITNTVLAKHLILAAKRQNQAGLCTVKAENTEEKKDYDYTGRSCRDFCDILASADPVPGGGGASALCGAIGAALGGMVASLTVGKKKYIEVEEEFQELRRKLKTLQDELLQCVREDAEGFAPLAKAYSMPRETEEEQRLRCQVLEQESELACRVPLKIMDCCAQALDLLETAANKGSALAISDAVAGALLCSAALESAGFNVYINTASMNNRDMAGRFNEQASELIRKKYPQVRMMVERVTARLGGGRR